MQKNGLLVYKKKDGIDFEELIPTCTELGRDFVKKLLEVNPDNRIKVDGALRHVFLKEFFKEADKKTCPTFDLSFEFEAAIKTAFGVRHMMYEELLNYKKNRYQRLKQKIITVIIVIILIIVVMLLVVKLLLQVFHLLKILLLLLMKILLMVINKKKKYKKIGKDTA